MCGVSWYSQDVYCNDTYLEPALIAKSNVILDVKPWDDETDMNAMERQVRNIHFDGLVWGACMLKLMYSLILNFLKRLMLIHIQLCILCQIFLSSNTFSP